MEIHFMNIRKTLTILALGAILAPALVADMRVSTSDAIKAATNKPQPEYSAIARQMKVAGRVEIEVTIATDGTVESAKALSGNPLLTQTATTTVKKWKFAPFTANGEPSKAVAILSFDFKP
jgi:TonB family protein